MAEKTGEDKARDRYRDAMRVPEGRTCGDCAHWERCKALIHSLNPESRHCDFSPSRYREKE